MDPIESGSNPDTDPDPQHWVPCTTLKNHLIIPFQFTAHPVVAEAHNRAMVAHPEVVEARPGFV
jgi:hypothetical protein